MAEFFHCTICDTHIFSPSPVPDAVYHLLSHIGYYKAENERLQKDLDDAAVHLEWMIKHFDWANKQIGMGQPDSPELAAAKELLARIKKTA